MSDDNTELQTPDELTVLKARADRMNIAYHPSIGLEKLREKVNAAVSSEPPAPPEVPAQPAVPAALTEGQAKMQLKREALKLIRIRLSCMNPAKKEWDGEIFTVGNSLVGSITKFVPFNVDSWHVPQILLYQLQERSCQVFTTLKTQGGVSIRKGKLIKEFAIEILPPLTEEELHDLAQRQAMSHAID
jgi:hypothetical protein